MNVNNILIRNGYINIPVADSGENTEALATVLMNIEYYGFALGNEAFRLIKNLSPASLAIWWSQIEPEFKEITGDNRNIGDFVVYKNFPQEVLNKTDAEYWFAQILMYWGVDKSLFAQPELPRSGLKPESRKSKVLMASDSSTTKKLLHNLVVSKVKWNFLEFEGAKLLSTIENVDFSKIQFKENLVNLASYFIENGIEVKVKTATDVLRLGAGLSGGDSTLKTKVKFKSFSRPTRRFLLSMLENSSNLEEDVARRKIIWKKFLHNLHPREMEKAYPKVAKVVDLLFNDKLKTFNSTVEQLILSKDPEVLNILSSRPGEFSRRLVKLLEVFDNLAMDAFITVLPKLNLYQILSINRFLQLATYRKTRMFPPKGNWAKVKLGEARKVKAEHAVKLTQSVNSILKDRVPKVSLLDSNVEKVKLPNGNEEGVYARGTVIMLPKTTKFIRTASYWEKKADQSVWFDNGWNFFNSDWKALGSCCWNMVQTEGAVFSGDPTTSKEMNGRGAQLIDLYPEKLIKSGVRYAVWSVLCYSSIPFSNADVFAALQTGEDPQTGKLFEPSRCDIAFKINGDYKTKFICYLDLQDMSLTYIDANLPGSVRSAVNNSPTLEKVMPAYIEYLSSLPSVFDLFCQSLNPSDPGKSKVIYSDEDIKLAENETAYIFKHINKTDYNPLSLSEILNG